MSGRYSFTVDTEPMAQSIDGVNKNVAVVGAAVGAMEVAIVAAEKEMTDTICQSIDSGFYTLLTSRFSQRLSQFSSTMSSRVGSMMETAKAIDHTREQMQGDFNRIKSRYVKVFASLDRHLEERVRDLDRDAIELSRTRTAVLTGRQVSEVPRALMYTTDTQGVALKAGNARLKARVQDSIGDLSRGARQIVDFEESIEGVSTQAAGQQEPQTDYLPVAYAMEESMAAPGRFMLNPTVSPSLSEEARQAVVMGVRRNGAALTATSPQQMDLIRSRFMEEMGHAQLDDRTRKTMLGLFDRSFGQGSAAAGAVPAQPAGAPAAPGTQAGDRS